MWAEIKTNLQKALSFLYAGLMRFQSLLVFILFSLISSLSWSQDHNYTVCYEGEFLTIPSDKAVREKFNLPRDIKFKFTFIPGISKRIGDEYLQYYMDDNGNKGTAEDMDIRCFEDKGTMISYVNNKISDAVIGEDGKPKIAIYYHDNYPFAKEMSFEKFSSEYSTYDLCPTRDFEYDYKDGEIGFIDIVFHRKVINNKCAVTAIIGRDTLSIVDPPISGSSPEYVINKKNIELHAKYIPLYQACVQQDFRIENKVAAEILIKDYIEDIKTAIDYGMTTRDEMNKRDKEGRKLVNAIKARGFYSDYSYQEIANDFLRAYDDGSLLIVAVYDGLKKIENFCARFNQLALDHQIEETEGPY